MKGPDTRISLPSRRNLSNRGSEPYGPRMRFQVLGPLEVDRPRRADPPRGAQQRPSSRTCLSARTVVAADVLIDEVWGESRPTPPGTPSRATSHTSAALGADRSSDARPATSCPSSRELDAARFEALREARAANGPRPCGGLLREALDLWTGPAFADLAVDLARRGDRAARRAPPAALEERIAADLDPGGTATSSASSRR